MGSAYKSMIGHEVKGKISNMYRMESPAQSLNNKKKMLRQKIKTIVFFIMDVLVCAVCLLAFGLKYDDWKSCHYEFDLWIFTLSLFGVLSLIVDIASFLLLKSIQNKKISNNNSLVEAGQPDSWQQKYKSKRRAVRIQRTLVIFSVLLDMGMLG